MSPKRSRTNPLALAVLVCLHERPMHPYQIAQTLRDRVKHESVRLNYGSLYSVVDTLERKGLIKATGTDQEGRRPQRTTYAVTDAGATEMTDWLTEIVSTPVKEYPAFMAGLSFLPALDPDDALAALHNRAQSLAVRLAALRGVRKAARAAGLPKLFDLEGNLEIAQLATELTFVNEIAAELADGSLDGLDLWHRFRRGEIVDPLEVAFTFDIEKS